MRTLLVRADGGSRIGAGHVMRCLALAQTWRKAGGRAVFLTHTDSEGLRQRIETAGSECLPLERPYPAPSDLPETLSTLRAFSERDGAPPWLVLDGYDFDAPYARAIREAGYPLLRLDDNAHLPEYPADLLLNQNIHAESLSYRCDPDTRKLLGTAYVLLRPEFLEQQVFRYSGIQVFGDREPRRPAEAARRVLVTLGGSDPDNVTLTILRALRDLPELEVRVVAGPANPHLKSLERLMADAPDRIELLTAVRDMPALMEWADVAIVGAGSTTWELSFMGVPSLLIVLAENQRQIARGMDDAGAAISLGEGSLLNNDDIRLSVERVVGDSALRERLAARGRELVDGHGAERVIEAMTEVAP